MNRCWIFFFFINRHYAHDLTHKNSEEKWRLAAFALDLFHCFCPWIWCQGFIWCFCRQEMWIRCPSCTLANHCSIYFLFLVFNNQLKEICWKGKSKCSEILISLSLFRIPYPEISLIEGTYKKLYMDFLLTFEWILYCSCNFLTLQANFFCVCFIFSGICED